MRYTTARHQGASKCEAKTLLYVWIQVGQRIVFQCFLHMDISTCSVAPPTGLQTIKVSKNFMFDHSLALNTSQHWRLMLAPPPGNRK